MSLHDSGYKKIFSHPKMAEDLIKNFVKADFVSQIDFSTLEELKNTYVSDDYKNFENDVIYKIKYQGEETYFYILLEFQSTPDFMMPVRMLNYILLFYQDLYKKKSHKLKKLPAVFPILLYNGDRVWNVPEKLSELIDCRAKFMREHIPEFKYYKIDENEFSKKSLESLESINASMFLFEKSNYSEIGKYTKILIEVLEKEAGSELKRDFVIWLRQKFKSLKAADINLNFDSIHLLKEDVDVFETRIQKEIKQLKKQCRLEGINEGQMKGRIEGKLEGITEGQLKGKLEGITEGQLKGKLEVAKTMLQKGFDVKTISQITGLDAQEILK